MSWQWRWSSGSSSPPTIDPTTEVARAGSSPSQRGGPGPAHCHPDRVHVSDASRRIAEVGGTFGPVSAIHALLACLVRHVVARAQTPSGATRAQRHNVLDDVPRATRPIALGRHYDVTDPSTTYSGRHPVTEQFKGTVNLDIRDSVPDWGPFEPPAAPPGAPNVVYVVLDDVGFSAMSCYGGPIETPNIDRVAADGIRYTQWHTTALCSPTRSCLLTGRNHTRNSMACITEAASG